MDQLRAIGKWIASFGKPSWTLDDHPIRFRKTDVGPSLGRRRALPWSPQIINVSDVEPPTPAAIALRLREESGA